MIDLTEIEAARERIAGSVVRTPLVRLHVEDAPGRPRTCFAMTSSSAPTWGDYP
jgi:hypothetical protein